MKNKIFLIILFIILIVGISIWGRAAITQISGLAVAQSSTQWNNLKDAAVGDNLTFGLSANGLYNFDGTNWDRVRGDTTNGLWVNIKNPTSFIVTGNKTPSDTYANPTDALNTFSLGAVWNSTAGNWNRLKDVASGGSQTSGLAAMGEYVYDEGSSLWRRLRNANIDGAADNGLASYVLYLWNGATYDRAPGNAANGIKVQGTVTVTPPVSGASYYAIKKANLSANTNFPFGFTSKKIAIETPSTNTDEVCVDYSGGVAACPAANTAGNDRIPAGRSIILDDFAVTSISAIAASGTQTVYIRAWN